MTLMERRKKLSDILHRILGSDNVYFNPPESIKMKYPAIVYTRAQIDTHKADNRNYLVADRFEVTFIHKDADSEIITDILELPLCSYNKNFKANDLYHDVFTIYIQ